MISPKRNRMTRSGQRIALEPKVMEVLVCLASRAQDVVSKQELLDAVWPGTFVSDHVLAHVIWQLRKALGSADLIETVPRRGYRLTVEAVPAPQIDLPAASTTQNGYGRRRWMLATAAVLAVVLGTGAFWLGARVAPNTQQPIRRMMILPLETTGSTADQRALVAGINRSLRERFLELHALQVVFSRSPAALYAGGSRKPLMQLAEETAVDAVLQGTASVADGRARIALELWDARSTRVILAETFERDLKDILWLYGDIVRKVAEAGKVTVADAEALRLGGPLLNAESVREYLLGLGLPAVSRETPEHFSRAIKLNPEFAEPYTAAAISLRSIANADSTIADAPRFAEQARAMARKGMLLDPHSARAAVTVALVEASLFWNWKEAGEQFERAEKLRPLDQTLARFYIEYLVNIRQCDKALAEVKRENQADPTGAWPLYYAHWIHYQCGQFDAAINEAQAALARDPSARWVHFHTAYAYALTGHYAQALSECEKAAGNGKCEEPYLLAVNGRNSEAREILRGWEKNGAPGPFFQALGYVGLGNRDRAFERLYSGYTVHDVNMRFIWDPALAPLRSDARFRDLACKIDLPPGACAAARDQ